MSIKYDVNDAAADKVNHYAGVLSEIAERHASLEALVATARAALAEADEQRRKAVSAAAGGSHDPSRLTAAIRAKSDAEAHLSALLESLAELVEENASATAVFERSSRMAGMVKRAELEKEAQTAAVDLDKAAALHSAAFEKWRDAKTVAHNFTIPYGNFTSSGAPAFPAGAGFTASASLHPEIRRDLARLAFPNSTGSVANPRVG